MTGTRLALAFLLLLPIACSNRPVKPVLVPAADDDDDVSVDPVDADGFVRRGDKYVDRGEYAKAIADYQEAIRLSPDESDGYDSLAWLLATCIQDEVRDGKRAVELATKACELSKWKDSDYLTTLAAAQAECGNFAEAIKWQKKALKLGFEDEEETAAAREHLMLYEEGKPYREK